MTDVTIPGVPGVHPTFVLVNPSVDQVTTFQNYLATGLTGRISTTATLAEQSSRTYRITFSNVGSPGPYGARYFGYYLYHSNNGTWTVIHGASASDWGYIEINWDAMIVGGAIDPVRFAKAVSHEMGHTKYGPHIYEYVETWPFAVPPTGAQLAQDGQMSADATEAYLAGESLVLSDATNHAVLDINGLPIIYSKANGTSQAVFEAEYLNQWARAIERNWPRGPDGAYTTRAHIPPRNIVSHSPSELAGEATVKEAVGIISTGGNDYLIVLLKNTRMVVAGALQELQELADTILIAGEASLQVDTSDLLGTIGSVLGREFAGDNPIAQIAVSSALQSVLTNIGEWMEANGFLECCRFSGRPPKLTPPVARTQLG